MPQYFIVVGMYSICFTVVGLTYRRRGLEKENLNDVIYGQKCLLTVPCVLILGGVVGVLSSLLEQERLARITGVILSTLWISGSVVLLIAWIRELIAQKKELLAEREREQEQAN